MRNSVLILDYGMGNLHSVKQKLNMIGVNATVSARHSDICNANKIIMPGVGHFSNAMNNLKHLNLLDALNEFALVQQKPILGICLGMQLMAKHSEEGNVSGLGWFDAEVVKFKVNDNLKYKIPHTGWNQVHIAKQSLLMEKISELSEFYFVHAYHFKENHKKEDVLTYSEYEYRFVSSVEKGNIFGVQFHPEKSHDSGIQLFKNFISL